MHGIAPYWHDSGLYSSRGDTLLSDLTVNADKHSPDITLYTDKRLTHKIVKTVAGYPNGPNNISASKYTSNIPINSR